MKRRFKRGVELVEMDFHSQQWTLGMLHLQGGTLYLCESSPSNLPPPYGMLHRAVVKACYSDTISFAGIEADAGQWLAQVWFCEVRRS
ncbi:hypothetical protein [Polaromonas sp.]|uniref:hypothetical protein n=1 Tax=Polaromonas sp. TaxID=1869339 RepID=UPI00352A7F30